MIFSEDLNVSNSNWGDVSGLFAGELPSLKKLDLSRLKNLVTNSMESIGMKALGTFFVFHLVMNSCCFEIVRRSTCFEVQLGRRQWSISRRVTFIEEIENVSLHEFGNEIDGIHWNEGVGYIFRFSFGDEFVLF